jgi:hypothetical protein
MSNPVNSDVLFYYHLFVFVALRAQNHSHLLLSVLCYISWSYTLLWHCLLSFLFYIFMWKDLLTWWSLASLLLIYSYLFQILLELLLWVNFFIPLGFELLFIRLIFLILLHFLKRYCEILQRKVFWNLCFFKFVRWVWLTAIQTPT